jgi:hypothetical protein
VSGLGVGFFPAFMEKDGLLEIIAKGMIGGLAGWAVVFILYLVLVAPKKAWDSLRPIVIKIPNQTSSPEIRQEHIEKHAVSIFVKNKSTFNSVFCAVFVSELPGVTGAALPWQIYSGNIPREDQHQVGLADWHIWPGVQDIHSIRILSERGGHWASVNQITLPERDHKIKILVRSPGLSDTYAWCRVFINSQNRLVIENTRAPNDH